MRWKEQVQKRYEVQYYTIIFKVQYISTSKAQSCILLITFIVSLVLQPVISAYLLIFSLFPCAPLACHWLYTCTSLSSIWLCQSSSYACDTPSLSWLLALLPSPFLPSLTISPVPILPGLAGLTSTPPPLPSLFLSCIPVHHCLLQPHHLTYCLPYSLISPCLALFLLVCPY